MRHRLLNTALLAASLLGATAWAADAACQKPGCDGHKAAAHQVHAEHDKASAMIPGHPPVTGPGADNHCAKRHAAQAAETAAKEAASAAHDCESCAKGEPCADCADGQACSHCVVAAKVAKAGWLESRFTHDQHQTEACSDCPQHA